MVLFRPKEDEAFNMQVRVLSNHFQHRGGNDCVTKIQPHTSTLLLSLSDPIRDTIRPTDPLDHGHHIPRHWRLEAQRLA